VRLISIFALFIFLFPIALFAESTTNIPADNPVYLWIDQLSSYGLIRDAIHGQRPWSQNEVRRLFEEASKKEAEIDNANAKKILKKLEDYFSDADRTKIHWLEEARVDYTSLQQPPTPLYNRDGVISPLVDYQEGRHYAEGSTLGLETTHRAQWTPHLSFYARPRFSLAIPDHGNAKAGAFLQQGYGKFWMHNFEVEMGRDSILWGQGPYGGILLSNNARPLDSIKLSNDNPLILPWIFKYLGPFKTTFFLANLGPEREFPYSFLTGLKFSFKPTPILELGFAQALMLGGNGSTAASTGDLIGEFFAYRPGIGFTSFDTDKPGTNTNLSNRIMGGEFRLRIPPLRHAELYYEMYTEACCGHFTSLYGYNTGLYFPRLLDIDNTGLRLEYANFSSVFYQHGVFSTGWMLNKKPLGHALGKDGEHFGATIQHDLQKGSLNHILFYDESSDIATEKLYGVRSTLSWPLFENGFLEPSFGYERIENENRTAVPSKNNFLGQLVFRVVNLK